MLLLIAIIGGSISNFTPCNLPLVPVYAHFAVQAASTAGSSAAFQATQIVVGSCISQAALGLFAGLGILLVRYAGLLRLIVAVGLILMGAAQLNWIALPTPRYQRPGQSIFLGLVIGLVGTPCTTPIKAALLLSCSQLGPLLSAVVMLVYAVCSNLLLILFVRFSAVQAFHARAKKHGRLLGWITDCTGALMIVCGVWYLRLGLLWLTHKWVA
jgi:cytochrome c biogenesis protein CcdA